MFQLTWQEHQVFVYDLAGKQKRQMRNPREGWGLTNDGTNLIFSDGGPSIYYADPQTFAISKTVKIKSNRPGDVDRPERARAAWTASSTATSSPPGSSCASIPSIGCIDAVADLRSLRELMTPDERRQIDAEQRKGAQRHRLRQSNRAVLRDRQALADDLRRALQRASD